VYYTKTALQSSNWKTVGMRQSICHFWVIMVNDNTNYIAIPSNNNLETWTRQRKIVTQIMNESVRNSHFDIPALERPQMLLELLAQSENFQDILENYASRIISRVAYGDAKYYARVRQASQGLLEAISAAKHLSILVPTLRYLPKWLSPWKKTEAARHADERVFFLRALNDVSDAMRQGNAPWSFMKRCLESQPKSGIPDLECAYIVGMLGVAGVLTTSSAMMTYLLAMTLHPEWQQRVQAEVDNVCGDRMPVMSDAPQMPVLRAVIMEVMRWRPIVPAAIPHRTTEDCFYDDYFIPKGTHIHATTWAITRNTVMYPLPDVFNPDRWLDPSSPNYKAPLTEFPSIRNFTSFGYGRRVCMGQDLTEHEFFLAIGGMAWAMSVGKKRDGMGREIDVPLHDYGALVITKPEKFPFEVKPRSEKKTAILEAMMPTPNL
jgi:cytochrome P450